MSSSGSGTSDAAGCTRPGVEEAGGTNESCDQESFGQWNPVQDSRYVWMLYRLLGAERKSLRVNPALSGPLRGLASEHGT